jgi:DNA adenine methylase Dam
MQRLESEEFINRIDKVIEDYQLSNVSINGYEYYGCSSSDGLSSYNRDKYMHLREDVNANKLYDEDYYVKLYVLIIYAFNNQIRFNRDGDFNLPPGKRDFNIKMRTKLKMFIDALHKQNAFFSCVDFKKISIDELSNDDFVYADPPYLITCASYNEQGGWTKKEELLLLELLDELSSKGVRFALSNVLEAKGKTNNYLLEWICNRPEYRVIDLNFGYNNSNYQRGKKDSKTREVLIVNY